MGTHSTRYNGNSGFFTKDGRYRGGIKCGKIPVDHSSDPAKEDRENREEVVKEIISLVKSGEKLEEVCDKLVDKYGDKFKYLPLENLSKIFAGWYNGRIRAVKPIEKGI